MDTNEVLSKAVDTVVEKPITFEISINPTTKLHAFLQRIGIYPKKKAFELRPVVLGNLLRISQLLLTMKLGTRKEMGLLAKSYQHVSENMETVIQICSIAIHNRPGEPPERLKALLRDNLSTTELMKIMAMVVSRMNVENFIASIILISGMNIMTDPTADVDNAS